MNMTSPKIKANRKKNTSLLDLKKFAMPDQHQTESEVLKRQLQLKANNGFHTSSESKLHNV
jgi:hypothetical protein